MIHTLVLQPNRVEHPGSGFSHPWIGVPFPVGACHGFHKDASDPARIHKIPELLAVPKCSGSRGDGILED